jgi:hypothetical protein
MFLPQMTYAFGPDLGVGGRAGQIVWGQFAEKLFESPAVGTNRKDLLAGWSERGILEISVGWEKPGASEKC